MSKSPHISVLLSSVLQVLGDIHGTIIDATFGAGGYTRTLLQADSGRKVIAFDRDESTVRPFVQKIEHDFPGRFTFFADCFSHLNQHISEPVDAIVADLGVSSMQIDTPERGFSWRFDAPLDMRMGNQPLTAADIVNTYSEEDLAHIIYIYGEEKASRRIAKNIVQNRPILSTGHLADVIHQVMPHPKDGSDSAMRTFQAIRIAVNDELAELEHFLNISAKLLKSGGKLVVVSFHSLEDRIVKDFLTQNVPKHTHTNKYASDVTNNSDFLFKEISRKPILPTPEELSANSRSHSAKLRWGVRA